MSRILVIDDEPGIVRFARRALEGDGHVVHGVTDALAGLRLAGTAHPDLVILDLLMPDISGFAVLSALLADRSDRRVMVVSAVGDVDARVRCLDLGAVDFLLKPFAVSELLARVRTRIGAPARQQAPAGKESVRVGGVTLDPRTRRLVAGGQQINLSHREYALAEYLLRRTGSVCTRSELLSEVWGFGFDPGSNVVDVTVARLRSKIRSLRIETVRNVGYAVYEA